MLTYAEIYRNLRQYGRTTMNDQTTCDGCGEWRHVEEIELVEPAISGQPEILAVCRTCLTWKATS